MKTKFTLLFLVLSLTMSNLAAQDMIMAKAFFKKALKMYEEKDYSKTIELLEKAKENLKSTNPEIIYLEAKARYKNDNNITKTKKLLRKFLDEASPSDNRIDEVSSLLVDIETSGNYFSNGIKKQHTVTYSNGNQFVKHYNMTGDVLKSLQVAKYGTTETVAYYYVDDKLYLRNSRINGKDYKIKTQMFYHNNGNRHIQYTYREDDKIKVTWSDKEYATLLGKRYQTKPAIPKVTNNPDYIWVYNDDGESLQHWSFNKDNEIKYFYTFKRFEGWDDGQYETYLTLSKGKYGAPLEVLETHDNEAIKRIKDYINKYKAEYYIYTINDNGIPQYKEYYKKDRLREKYEYNKSTKGWTRVRI